MIVTLRCPSCGHTWIAAEIVAGAWWASGITPHVIAEQCPCRTCSQAPPMQIVSDQLDLLAEQSA